MNDHFKSVCADCGTLVSQCRCPDPNKTMVYTICPACKEKRAKKENSSE